MPASIENILILGGTSFIGRNFIESLKGNDRFNITLYNRGKTNPHLFPNIRKIHGDRNKIDISKISEENWDYVVDFSCYYPESLEVVLDILNSKTKRYIFISTCSVYDNTDNQILKEETDSILDCTDDQKIDKSANTYGNRKAECERILKDSKIPYSILRPALVYGKYDPTDRLYYWIYQVRSNGQLLVPERGERKFSLTYVQDLVSSIIHLIQPDIISNEYNIITITQSSISQIINTTSEVLNMSPVQINASAEFLNKQGVSQWTGMPLWLNSDSFTFSNSKAKNELQFRPSEFKQSISDTIAYYNQQQWYKPSFGISESVRASLIQKTIKSGY